MHTPKFPYQGILTRISPPPAPHLGHFPRCILLFIIASNFSSDTSLIVSPPVPCTFGFFYCSRNSRRFHPTHKTCRKISKPSVVGILVLLNCSFMPTERARFQISTQNGSSSSSDTAANCGAAVYCSGTYCDAGGAACPGGCPPASALLSTKYASSATTSVA